MISVSVFSQNLQIIEMQGTREVDIGKEIVSPLRIKNISDYPIHLGFKLSESIIGSSQEFTFCWNNECIESLSQGFESPIVLQPGEVIENLTAKLNTGIDETFTSLVFQFYDINNPDDVVEAPLSFIVNEPSKGLLYSNDDLVFNDIYPNPINETGFLEYQIKNTNLDVKIVIHNVLGSVITEYQLNPLERVLKIQTQDYRPGVYFYSLHVDNEGKVTKKMIIRK